MILMRHEIIKLLLILVRFNYYEIAMIPTGATLIKVEEKSENILGII